MKEIKRLSLLLLLIILLVGCSAKKIETNCPKFPIPPLHVLKKFDKLAEEDKDIWKFGNDLRILCCQLGQCVCD